MSNMRHMDPDLVGPPGLQDAADVGPAAVALQDLPVGDRPAGVLVGDGHFLPVRGVAADGGVHGALILPEAARTTAS